MPEHRRNRKEFEKVLKKVETFILTGQFRPGQRLVESELTQRLQVSRYWIRDALKVLAEKGLVKIIPYKGAVVSDLSPDEIENIFIIRVSLERLAVHLAVQRLTTNDLQIIKKHADQFAEAHKLHDIERMIQHNADFHDSIFKLADNPPLMQLILDMRTRLHIIRYSAWASEKILHQIVKEHQLIHAALKDKDLETLDAIMEQHISYSKDYYLSQLKTIEALIKSAHH